MTEEEEIQIALTESQRLRSHYLGLLPPANEMPAPYGELVALGRALEESVALQTLYARLVNTADGGRRQGFADADAWIARLRETGKLPGETS